MAISSQNDYYDVYYAPLLKCKEYVKKYFESSKDELFIKIEKSKYIDKSKPLIDIDLFSAIIIEQHHLDIGKIRDSSYDIFCACDLDNSGYMEFAEFYFIFKYIEPTKFSIQKCKEIFSQNYEQANSGNKKIEVISFNRFTEICSTHKLFGEKAQNAFMSIQNSLEIDKYSNILNRASTIISNMKSIALNLKVYYKYLDTVLNTLQDKLDVSNNVTKSMKISSNCSNV